jgi:hypothetical protein
MEKLIIDLQAGKLNVVRSERMETLPMGTLLYCSATELRSLADMMDDPTATPQQLREAAVRTADAPQSSKGYTPTQRKLAAFDEMKRALTSAQDAILAAIPHADRIRDLLMPALEAVRSAIAKAG